MLKFKGFYTHSRGCCLFVLLLLIASNTFAQFTESDARVIHEFEVVPGNFGWAVSELQDIDGDGVTDFISGDTGNSKAFVYSGSSGQLLYEFSQPGNLGYSVADAGDVNNDGVHDIIAGATALSGGRAYVYSGADGNLLFTLNAESTGDNFGYAVSSAGDVNGDGHADVLVGAQTNRAVQPGGGRGYIFSGSDGSLIRTLDPESANDRLGVGTALMGDVNGDGVQDHIIGADRANGGRGRAYIYSGADGTLLYSVDGDVGGANFSTFFVAGVGDVNNDGTPDGYVGDFSHNSGAGRAYVFSGVDGTILYRFSGNAGEGAGPGRGAGDVNNDGYADIIVGFYTAGTTSGRVEIYSGKDGSLLQRITHTIAGAQFGFDAVGVKDVDGDGRYDYLVSASVGNKVYAMAGSVERPADSNFLINGGVSGAWADTSVSGQGLMVDVFDEPDRKELFVAWFTYDVNAPTGSETDGFGSDRHRWFSAQGPFDGNRAELTIFLTSGGQFVSALETTTEAIGTLVLEFENCTSGQASYTFTGTENSGAFSITKLLPATLCETLQPSNPN